ncbi:hypothetical protein CW304_30000 [Bacillus sp. UFRGS-B20]|nr:hypothetical protein CW304_30000 [Bacillus sp. UFRGS-B20]
MHSSFAEYNFLVSLLSFSAIPTFSVSVSTFSDQTKEIRCISFRPVPCFLLVSLISSFVATYLFL